MYAKNMNIVKKSAQTVPIFPFRKPEEVSLDSCMRDLSRYEAGPCLATVFVLRVVLVLILVAVLILVPVLVLVLVVVLRLVLIFVLVVH